MDRRLLALGTHLRATPAVQLTQTVFAAGSPPGTRHVFVFAERGRFGGWPANHGLWKWGDEILVGFSAGTTYPSCSES
jgi:hypothetical protein